MRHAQPMEAANLWCELLARRTPGEAGDSLVLRARVGLGATYAQAGRWTLAHQALRAALAQAGQHGRGRLLRWTQARAYWVALSVARLGHRLYAERITPDLDGGRQDRAEAAALCAELAAALGPAWRDLSLAVGGPAAADAGDAGADTPPSTPLPVRALLLCQRGEWAAAVHGLTRGLAARALPALEREEACYLLSCSLLNLQRPQEALGAFARYSALACERQQKAAQGLLPRHGPPDNARAGDATPVPVPVPTPGLSGPRLQQLLEPLRAGAGWPVSVASLAAKAGVSPRVLNDSFRRHLGTTALACLSELRLHAFRAALLGAGPSSPGLAALATAFGYSHVGRLAAQYRLQFGETPAQTRQRAAAPAPARPSNGAAGGD